jgi:predicted esterase
LLLAACRAPHSDAPKTETETDAATETETEADAATVTEAATDAATEAAAATAPRREKIGPFETIMMPNRTVWYALPRAEDGHRLVAHLHGQCAPPVYSCGSWIDAGAEYGFMVCPTGNEHCNDSGMGPAMWDESFALMDSDLERGIAVVQRKTDGGIDRDGAVLTGFSRGGWAAIDLVRRHPGRWPYLVLIEADVTINKAYLEASKVRAVAMVAGEHGTELAGERKSVDAMKDAGYPAELYVMPDTAHLYSTNIDEIMRQALAFVLAH